jgi:hypothetical protein
LNVVESLRDAAQVAYAVAVGVLEAARIDLVHHRFFPPGFAGWRGRNGSRIVAIGYEEHGGDEDEKSCHGSEGFMMNEEALCCKPMPVAIISAFSSSLLSLPSAVAGVQLRAPNRVEEALNRSKDTHYHP